MTDNSQAIRHAGALRSFKETIESLIIAFILAFVFRAFTVEAFIIPTGSMADTLRGAHFRLVCRTCGYAYNVGYGNSDDTPLPIQPININPSRLRHSDVPICPLCGTEIEPDYRHRVSNGDRILVLKYLYFFSEPEIWDVVVFKNPTDPSQNFIKRLIGRPGETVEIIDGDVYINGKIQRKPDHVQEALWIPVYHSDYQPPPNAPGRYDRQTWDRPFQPVGAADAWTLDAANRRFEFEGSRQMEVLEFNTFRIKKFSQNFLAYNGHRLSDNQVASDLKLSFVLTADGPDGKVIVKLGKYNRLYRAEIEFNGLCRILSESDGETILKQEQFAPLRPQEPVNVSFALVDHTLQLRLGDWRLDYIGDERPGPWGFTAKTRFYPPSVHLAGQGGAFRLKHIALYRDVHYTNSSNGQIGRGTEENAFTLNEDEFFVLGDNSPQSHDSRFWDDPPRSLYGKACRAGVVPRYYLIGRALFVYWPAGFYIHPNIPFAPLPNLADMRFIH